MKKIKDLILIVLITLSFISCNSQNKTSEAHLTATEFAVEFYDCLKNNDFERLKTNLPKAPFDIYLKQKEKNLTFTKDMYDRMLTNLEANFVALSQTINNKNLKLEKIETESNIPFQFTEIFLTIRNRNEKYKIRIEDCLTHNGKYLPEQLKFWKE